MLFIDDIGATIFLTDFYRACLELVELTIFPSEIFLTGAIFPLLYLILGEANISTC